MKRLLLFGASIALVLLVGCGRDPVTAPRTQAPAVAVAAYTQLTAEQIRAHGTYLGSTDQGDVYRLPNGVSVIVGPIKVVTWYDYPCSFVGPLPAGHERACAAPFRANTQESPF